MYKILITLCLALLFTQPAYSQDNNKNLDKAERLFEEGSYRKALELLLPLAEEGNKKAIRKIADCYRKLNDPHNEAVYLAKVVEWPNVSNNYYLLYGQALMKAGRYSEAKKWLLKYSDLMPDDDRGKLLAARCDSSLNLAVVENDYAIYRLNINTPVSELCPAYYKNGIVYTRFDERVMTDKKYMGKMSSYMNMYIAEKDSLPMNFEEPEKLDARINTPLHDGPGMFNYDGSVLYFTRNNETELGKKNVEGLISLGVYASRVTNGDFGPAELLDFNGKVYSCAHPSPNKRGDIIIFTSDMGGGLGGKDLFYSEFMDSTGKWGRPVNMGAPINTSGNERYPYLHPDGTLYFSSDGHPGIGGMDVFMTKPTGGKMEFGKVQNLGRPVNSEYDDFSLVCDEKHLSGYFASNRPGGEGSDDLYYFIKASIPMVVTLQNSAGKSVRYELRNTDRNYVQKTGEQASLSEIKLLLEPASSYQLSVWVNNNAQPVIQNIVTGNNTNTIQKTITLP